MTSDFGSEVANSPKVAPDPKIVRNGVQASCLALLSDAACFADHHKHGNFCVMDG